MSGQTRVGAQEFGGGLPAGRGVGLVIAQRGQRTEPVGGVGGGLVGPSRVDAQFSERLAAALAASGTGKDDALYFICRSGGRSRMAAEAMAEAGFRRCSNVAEGFEGPLDDSRHRGQVAGWKASGLPWMQG